MGWRGSSGHGRVERKPDEIGTGCALTAGARPCPRPSAIAPTPRSGGTIGRGVAPCAPPGVHPARLKGLARVIHDYRTICLRQAASPPGKDVIELLAAARALSLDDDDKEALVLAAAEGDRTATGAYNANIVGNSSGPTIAGGLLLAMGAIFGLTGWAVSSRGLGEDEGSSNKTAGGMMALGGFAMLLVGAPSLLIGVVRMRSELPANTLESASADELRAISGGKPVSKRLEGTLGRLRVLPAIESRGGGLGLAVTF